MQFKFGAMSDVGKVRKNNEDSYKIGTNYAIVADGMGGHKKGEVASKMAVEIVADFISGKSCGPTQAIEAANAEVYKKAQTKDFEGMGTTAVVCVVTNEKITIVKILFADSFIILNPAFKIKNATAHLIPTNAYATYLFSKN